MDDKGVLIIGTGQAGYQLAMSLRDSGFAGPIRLLGDEPELPYQRPPLSKAFLSGGCEAAQLTFQNAALFASRRIELVTQTRAATIERDAREVVTTDGRRFGYDDLVLAVGARNRLLRGCDDGLAGLRTLRTLADAQALRDDMTRAKRAVVVGAGFIGLEFAAIAAAKGIAVHVIEAAPHVMCRAVSTPVADAFRDRHQSIGVTFAFQTGVDEIQSVDGRVTGVRTTDGKVVPADLVVVSIGVVPNIELAHAAGLDTGNGIVVDRQLRTSDPHIWAIGDCAAFPSRFADHACRLESIQNAVDQARHLARTLCGKPQDDFEAVPWFWTDQAGLKLQIAGLHAGADQIVVRGEPAEGKFSTFCFRDGKLLAVESIGRPADHMTARKLLAASAAVTPQHAADSAFDLKQLLPQRA